MGKLQEFEITFEQNKVMYSPGESISGIVTVKLGQPLQCKAIKVNCNGFCGITNKVNDTAWMIEEQYFNTTVSVADKGTLKQGAHTFPFKFLIPATAPTSFEGNYGRIIYRVRAFIDTPRFTKNYNTEKAFYMLSLLNLNKLPEIWRVTYETKRPTHDVRTIAEVEGGVVKAGKEVEWKEQIIVSPLPQSSLAGCELIKIEYYVKVCLKSPDVMLTLPIHIGNVSLDKKRQPPKKVSAPSTEDTPASASSPETSSALTPTLPSRPDPNPAPRPATHFRTSSQNSPSAPPAEYHPGAQGGALMSEDFQNKRQSQLVSPNAFSYAPGLFFPQNQHPSGPATTPNGLAFSGSTGATTLYPSVNGITSVATPHIVPPDYNTSGYPQGAPPSYNESCNT
ncbi:arrestin domain-containing protein 1a isoform X4 [Archocentrus centrarchus]|uniref:arrestin domain-containing protein 1a isoform X4 n=1 Tax=Archocentrus centrarchus TaxID=63155 RepID=UPI0011E9DA50|nr:arrestin domain-containing protein 1-like isoform X4 [Archocentrus centrarchus]